MTRRRLAVARISIRNVDAMFTAVLAVMLVLAFRAASAFAADNIIPLVEARMFLNYNQPPASCKNQTGPIDDSTGDYAIDSDGSDTCENETEKRTSDAGSLIDNVLMAHYHAAADFELPRGSDIPACLGCGAGGPGPLGGDPPSLEIRRVHRYRDLHYNGSFGPGVFMNYDVFLKLSRRIPGGAGIIRAFDPAAQVEYYCDDTDDQDGVYEENNYKAFASITLFDADGGAVADQGDAATAELVTHGGRVYAFEIFRTSTDPETHNRWGRLTEIRDRGGDSILITHAYVRNATDEELGYDRNRLWMKDTVTDPYGREASFAYAAETVSGGYVIERIDLPTGSSLLYHYENEGLDLPGGDIVGLSAVDFPTGDRATITTRLDEESQCQVVTYFDPAAPSATDRAKDVYMTLEEWVDPRTHDVVPVRTGMVRMVAKGDDEVLYLACSDPRRWGTTMVYEGGGSLYRYVTRGGYPIGTDIAASWTWNSPPGRPGGFLDGAAIDWVRSASYQVDDYRHVTGKSDELGRRTSFDLDGKHSAIRTVTYPDGTRITRDYNGFRQLTREVDRLGRVTEFSYDADGNLLEKTAAAGTPDEATWSWTYSGGGPVETATDANGNVTEYTWSDGFLTAVREPADEPGGERAVTRFLYDEAGRVAEKIDPDGAAVYYIYDGMNRLVQTSFSDGSFRETVYGTGEDAGLVKHEIDRNGNVTSFRHDAAGRVIGVTEAAGSPERVRTSCTYLAGTRSVAEETACGETTTYGYDAQLRRISTTVYPDNQTTLTAERSYNEAGRLFVETDPYGCGTWYVYGADDNNLVRTIVETVAGGVPEGADLRALPRILTPNAPYLVTETVYDDEDRVTARIDGRGIRSTFAYDARNRVVERVTAAGTDAEARTEYDYDAQGNLAEVRHPRHFTEPGGFRTVYTYTGRNLQRSVTEAAGRAEEATVSCTYTPGRKRASETDARGNTTLFGYGGCCGRLERVEDALGGATLFDYDFRGNLTGVTDPLGHSTVAAYDGLHRVSSVTNPEGETTTYTYDDDLADGTGLDYRFAAWISDLNPGDGCDGQAILATDAGGGARLLVRDAMGRTVRTAVFDSRGRALTFATTDYDGTETLAGFGEVEKTDFLDGLMHVSSVLSDGAGRKLATMDAEDFVTEFFNDALGNVVFTVDPNGNRVDFAFDAAGRPCLQVDGAGDTVSCVYNSQGLPTVMIDGFGNAEFYFYDARNRRTGRTDREGRATFTEYDANGNRTKTVDPGGSETRWIYDELNRVEEKIYPDLGSKRYSFDAAGRLTASTDQAGRVTSYEYDDAGRLVRREYPDLSADLFGYDGTGRLVEAASGLYGSTVARAYDAAGRLTGERTATNGRNYRVEYEYDLANRAIGITYPDGRELVQTFNDRNQLVDLTFDGGFVQARDYDAGGRLTATDYGNGLVESRTWREDDLPATILTPGVIDFAFGFDASKRKTVELNGVLPDLSLGFAYDASDQLTGWERDDDSSQLWTLGPSGDWDVTTVDGVPEARLHNPAHELIRRDDVDLLYNASGNLALDAAGAAYEWDFENRLAAVHDLSQPVSYAYDALGRRVAKTVGGNVTVFVYDGNRVLAEYENGESKPARAYVYGPFIDEPLMMTTNGPTAGPAGNDAADGHGLASGDDPADRHNSTNEGGPAGRSESCYYYHADNMFQVTALTDQAGNVLERYSYRAFGRVSITTPSGDGRLEVSAAGNPYNFQGRRLDDETGLYYHRARYYHPDQGRFISRDPVDEVEWRRVSHHLAWGGDGVIPAGMQAGDANPYRYVGNGPANALDPTGLIKPGTYTVTPSGYPKNAFVSIPVILPGGEFSVSSQLKYRKAVSTGNSTSRSTTVRTLVTFDPNNDCKIKLAIVRGTCDLFPDSKREMSEVITDKNWYAASTSLALDRFVARPPGGHSIFPGDYFPPEVPKYPGLDLNLFRINQWAAHSDGAPHPGGGRSAWFKDYKQYLADTVPGMTWTTRKYCIGAYDETNSAWLGFLVLKVADKKIKTHGKVEVDLSLYHPLSTRGSKYYVRPGIGVYDGYTGMPDFFKDAKDLFEEKMR